MLHHEESPEKPQYNMATSPFLDKPPTPNLPNPPFSSKHFQTAPPPISINFEKVEPPSPLYEGERSRYSRFTLEIQQILELYDLKNHAHFLPQPPQNK